MAQKRRRSLGALGVGIAVLATGCALHTPERAAVRFVYDLSNGVAQSEGSLAFDRTRIDLHLTERPPKQTGGRVYRRSATWSRRKDRIGLVSSNVLRDPPDRFDLRLSWTPPRPLRTGLLEELLGPPYGRSATRDNGWVMQGGILEYRATETETPYLLFSSPGYIRDPLDFLEAASLPHLPSLASVTGYLERNGSDRSPRRVEEGGLESETFHIANGISITAYSGFGPQRVPYLAGLTISIASRNGTPANATDFLPILRDLGIPTPEHLVEAVSGARPPLGSGTEETRTDSFAVYNNFAVALTRSPEGDTPATNLALWRRIESPRSLCEHLRPDLERCSSGP
jgi:hypothetical protein